MDKFVDDVCKHCIPCMSASPVNNSEPVKSSPLPSVPWDEVSIDFCGPFPNGDYAMVVIFNYARFPVVEIIRNISAQSYIDLTQYSR